MRQLPRDGELLALTLRPGNAGANTAADHLQVLGEALAQVPAGYRRRLLIRGDSAAATHAVLAWLHDQNTCDLIAWPQLLALDGDLARAEPKRLRYRILHTAARLTHGQRRRWLRIPTTWPWASHITTAFTRITAIPAPG